MDGFRPDAIVIDAPRFSRFHLPKFIVFLGVEGLLIATGVLAYSEPVPKLCICCPFLILLIFCVLRRSLVPLVAVLPHWCQASSTTSTRSLHKSGCCLQVAAPTYLRSYGSEGANG
jgi:hypothetical protein